MVEWPVTVVIADDYDDLRMLLRLTLDTSGKFTVVAEAANGRQAVELSRLHEPQLVLLDVSMPELDGLEALPLIREASPSTIIVMLSGFEEARLGKVAESAGASAYLEKGLPPDRLVERLVEVLTKGTG